jgi:hypothetical protein
MILSPLRQPMCLYTKSFMALWFTLFVIVLLVDNVNAERGGLFSISYGQLNRLITEEDFQYNGSNLEWVTSEKHVRSNMFGVGLGFYLSRWTPQFEFEFMMSPPRKEGPDT